MRFFLTLPVWGDWHLDQFTRHSLPSLKASGNLDAVDYHISVHTRPRDAECLRNAMAGLNYDIKTIIADNMSSDRNEIHPKVAVLKDDDRIAAGESDAWVLLAPDMVWAEGTLDYYNRLFESGKKAIFRPLLRVDADKAGTITNFNKRALAKIAIDAEHDVVKQYYRALEPVFSRHAEMITWRVPSGGILNKTITAEVQVCLAKLKLHGEHKLAPEMVPEEMAVICDTDEGITLAMAKGADTDFRWLSGYDPLTPDTIKIFVSQYNSPVCHYIATKSYRLHDKDIDANDELLWKEVEKHADEFIRKAFS